MHQRVANTDLLNYNFGKVEHWPASTAGIVVFLLVIVIVEPEPVGISLHVSRGERE